MNDRQEPYDPYGAREQQLIGYDAYGRPVYGPAPAAPQAHHHDPGTGYADPGHGPGPHHGPDPVHGADPAYGGTPSYGGQQHYPAQPQQYAPPQYAPQQYPAAGTYGQDAHQQQLREQWIPHQQPAPQPAAAPQPPAASAAAAPHTAQVPEPRRAADGADAGGAGDGGGAGYRTEQFAFLDQPDEDSDDVIDWLKFTESRTERREEARRRGRNRVVALTAVLALLAVAGAGYLWWAGMLPFLGGADGKGTATAAGPQKRDMIVVHVHNTKKGGTSTALLVDNVTTGRGATVLLPNTLGVTGDDGTATPLGKAVEKGGLGVRESLDSVLGTGIGGTWRLDTPFLDNLVELVGGIEADTDTAIPADDAAKIPAVGQGAKQHLSGAMAVAYATHRAPGEPEAEQLERLGQVLYGVLRKIPGDAQSATTTVESMGQILDPSLSAETLGAMLARLGEHAKEGRSAYRTDVLGVKPDGSLTDEANRTVVKEVLGGSFTAAQPGAAPRVGLRDATGDAKAQVAARAALLNGGYTFVDGGKADRQQSATQVTYQDDAQRPRAVEVAKTLGLPETAVKKGENPVNADIVVTLGRDWKPS
ncbi:LytR family transcriptional regulator [Streptomyces globosus]|uniref:LytR family transcriptional regulator n=1 Tax=Streptomyces globosus TaxID=68209 RepID=A0A344U627_9ACTN|nr:LCP family protein [Streptomyces globosus]AXE26348.1 LytR family transcriptional regulator [Streptomyces globosus]